MLIGTFIGIDRHRHVGIRDLTGAARDATALWALFADTNSGIRATLLKDADATAERVRSALRSGLADATTDDVVIVTFSGHGTHDHRLVVHDTDTASLATTTISMDEVASLFKTSPARAVVCVIDCCFSGGAPARVLEDSPVPKDPGLPIEALAGKGRIIIAASNINEVAYESPTARHGLLTKALIDALQAGGDSVDVTAAMADVMENVRAAGAQLGIVQTPVMLGYVEGGLVLPALRAGRRYLEAFPEASGVRVGPSPPELAVFGLPAAILDEWGKQFSQGLNALQLSAVNDYRILDGSSLLVVAPTSSGKTFIGELAAAKAITEGRKAVFLLPYRALVNEKYDSFASLYSQTLGMRVVRCTGDHTDEVDEFVRGKYDLGVLTYEMFLNLAVGNPGVLNQIGLVVLDEGQFITDPTRGITVELLLTYLVAARERGIKPQLIALSAVIGDSNGLEEWLDCRKLLTTDRPVPLIEGVLDRSGRFQFVDVDGSEKTEQFLSPYEIQVRGKKASAQDVIVPLVRNLVLGGNEKVIVFRNKKGSAEGCARYLAEDLGLPGVPDALSVLPETDPSTTAASLRDCLRRGTAFHNTNLTRDEKQAVERAFRDPNGPLRVLTATTTVAAGINTPASTVIIAEQEFIGEDGRPFTIAEYKNMAGRAGRLGFNEQGKAIILAEDGYEAANLFHRYVRGRPEALTSSFQANRVETWIIRLLAQVKHVPQEEVVRLLTDTYGGFLAAKQYPGWRTEMEVRLRALLDRMIELGLVEKEAGALRLTLLGRACGQSSLALPSAMRLVEFLRSTGPSLNPEQLLALVQALPESDGGYTPLMRKGQKEAVRPSQAARHFGSQVVELLQHYVDDQYDFWARCKRAAILGDWISGAPVARIEQDYSTTPFQGKIGYGDVRRFADASRFHLRAAYHIATALFVDYGAQGGQIDALIKRLEVGLPADALGLLTLPIQLDRGDYLALHRQGARQVADVWNLADEELLAVLGQTIGSALAKRRPVAESQTGERP
jgi:ATP-dependent DNA helicase